MTRHSKNSSTGPAFTHSEREKLVGTYGTLRAICSADALLPVAHCFLCLQAAKLPHTCPEGHLACRECFIEAMLAAKSKFKADLQAWKQKEAGRRAQALASAKDSTEAKKDEFLRQNSESAGSMPKKRPHPDSDACESSGPMPVESISCTAGKERHPISLKSLVPVLFHTDAASKTLTCPSCLKPLSNGAGVTVLVECGHACCSPCFSRLAALSAAPLQACVVCSRQGRSLQLKHEGTGFAAGGGNVQVSSYTTAFQ